jgi:hypothetical protein
MVKIKINKNALFETNIPIELLNKREEEVIKIIEEYYWLPISTKIVAEIKYNVEKLFCKEIRKEKLKKIYESKR